jgi:hypothetical protein
VYSALSDILQTFSIRFPVLWALLVMGVMAATSLVLYVAWELVVSRLPFERARSRRSRRR